MKFDLELCSTKTLKENFCTHDGFKFYFGAYLSNKDKQRIRKALGLDIGHDRYYLELTY